jgi:membrane-associated protein
MFDQIIAFFHQVYNVQGLIHWGGLIGITLIIFSETGLMVGFFLPGDSLLVTAGLLTSQNVLGTNIFLTCLLLTFAAICGNSLGYLIGTQTGPMLFRREKSLLFNPKHLVTAREFYERHGGKAIIMAQFVPIFRTFTPVVAGIGSMHYRRFISFNVIGAVAWIHSMVLLGYFLGNVIPGIDKHIDRLIIVVIIVSLTPMMIHFFMEKKRKQKENARPKTK